MKFLEQVNSYQKALIRKSRFFTSLMLVSGIGLAAAAPFLSYEVSQIECHEIGSQPPILNCDDEIKAVKYENEKLKKDLDRTEKEKVRCQKRLTDRGQTDPCPEEDQLREELLACETEKENLEERIIIIEKEKEVYQEQLAECEQKNPCPEVDQLKKDLTTCEREKKVLDGRLIICDRQRERIKSLETQVEKWKKQYADCNSKTIKPETTKISGIFYHNENFTFNGDKFSIKFNPDDVGARFFLYHNNRDVTRSIKATNRNSIYSYNGVNKKKYRITFNKIGKNKVYFTLASR